MVLSTSDFSFFNSGADRQHSRCIFTTFVDSVRNAQHIAAHLAAADCRQLRRSFHIGGHHTFAVERVNAVFDDGSGTPQAALRQLPVSVLTDH